LVVAPKIVMISPIVGTKTAITKLNAQRPNVTKKFYLGVIFLSNTSSKESLVGNTQKGDANATTMRIPNNAI